MNKFISIGILCLLVSISTSAQWQHHVSLTTLATTEFDKFGLKYEYIKKFHIPDFRYHLNKGRVGLELGIVDYVLDMNDLENNLPENTLLARYRSSFFLGGTHSLYNRPKLCFSLGSGLNMQLTSDAYYLYGYTGPQKSESHFASYNTNKLAWYINTFSRVSIFKRLFCLGAIRYSRTFTYSAYQRHVLFFEVGLGVTLGRHK